MGNEDMYPICEQNKRRGLCRIPQIRRVFIDPFFIASSPCAFIKRSVFLI